MVDLKNFLLNRPESAKFVKSIIEDYKIWMEKSNSKKLRFDPVSQLIYTYLYEQFVVDEKEIATIFSLNATEVRSIMSLIESQLRNEVSVDRTNPKKWIIFIKEEALKRV